MTTRIADSNLFANAIRGTRLQRSGLNTLQNQVVTGKVINSVSDDPRGAARALSLRSTLGRIDQFERNVGFGKSILDTTASALNDLNDVLVRVRELAVSADVEDPQFDLIATEVEQRFGQILGIANTRVGDRFVFGGFVTNAAPVTQTGDFSDPAPIVAYNGDSGRFFVQIDESSQVQLNVTARELFFGDSDGDDVADGGRVNVFNVVQDLVNRLRDPATNGRPVEVLDDLDTAIEQTNQTLGTVGARENRLDSTVQQLKSLRVVAEQERSFIEDVDIVEALTELQSRETALQATLAVSARILQPSLLNFLG